MQKQGEDAAQAWVQVQLGLTAPHEPVVQDGPPAQIGADQVAVQPLVERGAGGVV